MSALHIVQGGIENGDKAWLEKAVRRKWSADSWTVPKTAKIGDEVVIFILGIGFFATAKVTTTPERCGRNRRNRYCAGLASIRLIKPAISLSAIEHEIPALTWTAYPRSYTTPPVPVARKIRKLIVNRRITGLPRLDEKSLEEANLDELRKVALLSAQARVAGKKSKATYRARSLAIRFYVLNRANGSCEGCRAPAPFHKPGGMPYLEPHHTTRLSDGGPDHPARVIGLCPNCHRHAHYAKDARQFNDLLKKKLARLEPTRRGLTPGSRRRRR